MWEMVKRSFDTTSDAIKVVMSAGSAAIGKLAANDGVDIGDVTVNNAAASGAYVRPGTSATWAVTSASQLPAALAAGGGLKVEGVAGGVAQPVSGTFWQTTQPVSATQLPAALGAQGAMKVEGVASGTVIPVSDGGGTLTVDGTVTANQGTASATPWPTKDAGPYQTVTRTYTTSADMTGTADLTAAPTAGQKIVLMDLIISTDTAMSFTIQEETSATVFAKIYLAANSTAQITPRGYLKAAVADKKIQGDASAAGNVAITAVYFSEA